MRGRKCLLHVRCPGSVEGVVVCAWRVRWTGAEQTSQSVCAWRQASRCHVTESEQEARGLSFPSEERGVSGCKGRARGRGPLGDVYSMSGQRRGRPPAARGEFAEDALRSASWRILRPPPPGTPLRRPGPLLRRFGRRRRRRERLQLVTAASGWGPSEGPAGLLSSRRRVVIDDSCPGLADRAADSCVVWPDGPRPGAVQSEWPRLHGTRAGVAAVPGPIWCRSREAPFRTGVAC